jgi:hypothetical protein
LFATSTNFVNETVNGNLTRTHAAPVAMRFDLHAPFHVHSRPACNQSVLTRRVYQQTRFGTVNGFLPLLRCLGVNGFHRRPLTGRNNTSPTHAANSTQK